MSNYTCKCPACGKTLPLSYWNQRRVCMKTGETVRIMRVKSTSN